MINKIYLIIILIGCFTYNNIADSLLFKKSYFLKKSNFLGAGVYGWQSLSLDRGNLFKNMGQGRGEVIYYERFIKDRLSLSMAIAHLNSFQSFSDFKIQEIKFPLEIKYYPKFLNNLGSFNLCFVNGYQKYTYNDSTSFSNFQYNFNAGLSLLFFPKKIFKKINTHWIFELDFEYPLYNFTKYIEMGSGYLSLKYNLRRKN